MNILMICKYPPIQGGVSAECYWTAQLLAEMGHNIAVLTNAKEVENAYRITMNPEDEQFLYGFSRPNSVRVVSSYSDRRHVFIPQTNPSVSKLLSLGLELAEELKPDFIWSHYLEPYGMVAMMLSKITGIPYVFRHAGSDIGRLMPTPQLKRIHHEVLRNAALILTRTHHHSRFTEIGVPDHKLAESISVKIRPDIFFPTPFEINSPMVLGVYGKVGENKGTGSLLRAMTGMWEQGHKVKLRAHWDGRSLGRYSDEINHLTTSSNLDVQGFIPHWRIPDFIRSCHAVMFLENKFSITFHQPSVPLEVLACGRPIITTREIANKRGYSTLLKHGENAFIIEGEVTEESVGNAILEMQTCLAGKISFPSIIPNTDIPLRIAMRRILDSIEAQI